MLHGEASPASPASETQAPENGKRIAIFIYALTGGGAQRRTLTLANGFAEHGYQVDLVTVRGRGLLNGELPPRARLVALHVGWGRWPPGAIVRTRGLQGYLPIPNLARYVIRHPPAVVLSEGKHKRRVSNDRVRT